MDLIVVLCFAGALLGGLAMAIAKPVKGLPERRSYPNPSEAALSLSPKPGNPAKGE